MDWVNVIVSILSGLAVAIPLVIELVKWVKKAVEEKNWQELLRLVTNLMKEAEAKFDNGADREEWCLMMVKASADTINYKIDLEQVRELIQSLCAMSKVVNAPKECTEEVQA
jgi:hypothetical protein